MRQKEMQVACFDKVKIVAFIFHFWMQTTRPLLFLQYLAF
jgi:hypothetical protein